VCWCPRWRETSFSRPSWRRAPTRCSSHGRRGGPPPSHHPRRSPCHTSSDRPLRTRVANVADPFSQVRSSTVKGIPRRVAGSGPSLLSGQPPAHSPVASVEQRRPPTAPGHPRERRRRHRPQVPGPPEDVIIMTTVLPARRRRAASWAGTLCRCVRIASSDSNFCCGYPRLRGSERKPSALLPVFGQPGDRLPRWALVGRRGKGPAVFPRGDLTAARRTPGERARRAAHRHRASCDRRVIRASAVGVGPAGRSRGGRRWARASGRLRGNGRLVRRGRPDWTVQLRLDGRMTRTGPRS
jgi:hypothetical protein